MPLVDVELAISDAPLPDEVFAFIREAESRVERYVADSAMANCGFVPSGFTTVYRALQAIIDANLTTGNSFCEWGSGFGAAAGVATLLGMDACGIEIDSALIVAARQLTADFDLPAEFVEGSFIPPGTEAIADDTSADFSWLAAHSDGAYEELGLGPDDFDLIFAYPWPGEEHVIHQLFKTSAAEGALLLTYDQFDAVRLQRKVVKNHGAGRNSRRVRF